MKKAITALLLIIIVISVIPAYSAAENDIILDINALNKGTNEEGRSLILTPKSGNAANGFAWWRTVTFEYNDKESAYIITSISKMAGSNYVKNNYIPKNGFVLCVNVGNDYSATGGENFINALSKNTYENIANLEVGMKAYVSGMNFEDNTIDINDEKHYSDKFVSNAKIYIGSHPDNVDIYKPDTTKKQLNSVKLNIEDGDISIAEKDFKFTWDEVEGADGYIVNINNSTSNPDGLLISNNIKTDKCEFVIPAEKFIKGNRFIISISAYNDSDRNSFNTKCEVSAVSERAVNSKFKNKKIVAFGDSITAIPGWVDMLTAELGTNIINAGVGGDTTELAIARVDKDVIAQNPDIVIMLFGMNDQAIVMDSNKPLVSLDKYIQNYKTILEKCRAIKADVVLLTGNYVCTDPNYYSAGGYGLDYGTDSIDDFFNAIRDLADEYGLNLIDINEFCKTIEKSKMTAINDGIHLSDFGRDKYCELISNYMYNEYKESDFVNGVVEESSSEEESEPVSNDESSNIVSDASDSTNNNIYIYIIIGIAVVVIITIIAIMIKRKK
ncbi:GDSL-type esterase/lipase family protein [Eubacteriales bacterium OttesenSCG-928-G02]|nr:GDSL-type esterase/lipase family protein [Eubacteriales bacterium OttesenSCG-928-G02]